MVVYVIMHYYFEETDICGVFSTKEKAEDAISNNYTGDRGNYVIVEREIDKI